MTGEPGRALDVQLTIKRTTTGDHRPFENDAAVEGCVVIGGAIPVEFVGWLELMGILERAVLGAASHEDLPS